MVVDIIFLIIILVALLIGTYSDFRWREVPDWLNFGLIFAGIGIRLIFTIITKDWNYLLYGLYGFIAAFIIAIVMFYAGQWGGGDSKMIMGIGVMIGLPLTLNAFFIGFFINTIIFGSIFGLLFSIYLALTHRKPFIKAFKRLYKAKKNQKCLIWIVSVLLIGVSIFTPFMIKMPLIVIAGMIFISFYSFIYLKAVEKSSMLKYIPPEQLTEGDWIAEDIIINKKYICGPKDLGIELPQIKRLIALKKKNKIKKILIKVGIPFVPSFLIAFVVTYIWGNIIFSFVGLV